MMMSNWSKNAVSDEIISLCYIRIRGDRTVEVCRFADFDMDTGAFSPYAFPRERESFFDTERDLLYGSSSLLGEQDSIALFSWHSYQDNNNIWKTDVKNCSLDWVEVLTSTFDSPEKIVEQIQNGWRPAYPVSNQHSLLVTCRAMSVQSVCVLIPRDMLVLRENKLYFTDDVISLPTGVIHMNRDTAPCIYRYSQSTSRRYLICADAFVSTGTVAVKSSDKVINSVIQTQIQKIDQTLITRKEKQAARSALTKLSMPMVSQIVSERLQCSIEHAKEYVEQYISSCKGLLDENSALGIIEMLIVNDSSYVQTLRIQTAKDWEEKQADHLVKVQAQIDAAQAKLDKTNEKVQEAKESLEKAEQRRLSCEAQTEDAVKLHEEIEERIKLRLASISQDRASALVETAFLQATLPHREETLTVAAPLNTAVTFSIDEPDIPETIADSGIADSFADAEKAWNELCAIKNMENVASELTAFSFAAYASHQPLIFVGEAAEAAADLYASSISGLPCTKVWLSHDLDEVALIESLKNASHDFICVVNGLERGYDTLRRLMQQFKESTFVITLPHAEALTMEPNSLFTTFFPVFLDCFCTETGFQALQSFSCAAELRAYEQPKAKELAKILNDQQKWFADGFTSPLLRKRCAKMADYLVRFYRSGFLSAGNAEEAALTLLFFPLTKCLNRKASISRVLEGATAMNDDLRKMLLAYAGIEKESEE